MTSIEDDRGNSILNRILRQLPGFGGYAEQAKRRESDEKARTWMADRLQDSKRGIDAYTHELADAGKIDELPRWEGLRARLDELITRIRSGTHSGRGGFAASRVDEDDLQDIYDFEADMLDAVDALAVRLEELSSVDRKPDISLLLDSLADVQQRVVQRDSMLKKLRPGG